jgi:hypothetical protein
MRSGSPFTAITSGGGLLPTDFLQELLIPKTTIEGVTPVAYHLAEGERIGAQVNRSWNRLQGCWSNFKKAIADKLPGDSTTTETRERWLLPLFQELGFGRLNTAKAIEVEGRSYPISHGWQHVPTHLVGSHIDIDRRTPGATGAARMRPHSLVQQALNASEQHLWGIVSNGFTLRLLRDNIALTRMAYVEWDLHAILDGELYSEFFLLWLVCHQSRFEGERPELCWLEKWKRAAEDKGLRALENLRPRVEKAIEAIGAGLLEHSANQSLRDKLRAGTVSTEGFYQQILRVIYRLLFLFVVEDRGLIHPPLSKDDATAADTALKARQRYRDFYSISRLRALTIFRAGTPHPDLWNAFNLVAEKLGSDSVCAELALPALGSFLWNAEQSTPDLEDCLVSNRQFLTAIHALAFIHEGNVRRVVDYRNLGAEELGSVYESLLELHPILNGDTGTFELQTFAGSERKTTGSYYTHDSLVQALLDSALEPVVAEKIRGKQGAAAAEALLDLKICDPAVGSGHFLIGAAHRLAKHIATARSGENEPSPEAIRTALREVIGRCLYGVDINPMSAELCKVSLWIEALEPGKPLSFLDHHIRVGNSLLGATPDLIASGIPDDAFKPIEGDERAACSSLKKLNRAQREGLRHLFVAEDNAIRERMHQAAAAINEIDDRRLEDIRRKEAAFRAAQSNYAFDKAWTLASLWCVAFVIKKRFPSSADPNSAFRVPDSAPPSTISTRPSTVQPGLFGGAEESLKPETKGRESSAPRSLPPTAAWGITTKHLRDFVENRDLPSGLLDEAKRLADQYHFFNWHLAFPEVFAQSGFDVILGNPPWERIKLSEQEFFAEKAPALAAADKAGRNRLIRELKESRSPLYQEFLHEKRRAAAESAFVRRSGLFPFTAQGDVNLFALFTEKCRSGVAPNGRTGLVVPTGLATDYGTSVFFSSLVREKRLVSLFDFENGQRDELAPPDNDDDEEKPRSHKRAKRKPLNAEERLLFPSVHSQFRFTLLTFAGEQGSDRPPTFGAMLHDVAEIEPGRTYQLSADEIKLVNPNTLSAPMFASPRHARIVKQVYETLPVLVNRQPGSNPWRAIFSRQFDMSNDREKHFVTREELAESASLACKEDAGGLLPLYEAKMVHQFDHRWATYPRESSAKVRDCTLDEKVDPNFTASPRYWVEKDEVNRRHNPNLLWVIGWRDITNPTNERTTLATALPRVAFGNKVPLLLMPSIPPILRLGWLACANSFAMDFVSRQKIGGVTYNFFLMEQMPFPTPEAFLQPCPWQPALQLIQWVAPRVVELCYTAWDLEPFARDLGISSQPFTWDPARRSLLRAELDAAMFIAYGIGRDDADFILGSFPVLRRREESAHGSYTTKVTILKVFDGLKAQSTSGEKCEAELSPPPAKGWIPSPQILPAMPAEEILNATSAKVADGDT